MIRNSTGPGKDELQKRREAVLAQLAKYLGKKQQYWTGGIKMPENSFFCG